MKETYKKVGITAFGNSWKKSLAKSLGIAECTARGWNCEFRKWPSSLHDDLLKVLKKRRDEIDALIIEMDK